MSYFSDTEDYDDDFYDNYFDQDCVYEDPYDFEDLNVTPNEFFEEDPYNGNEGEFEDVTNESFYEEQQKHYEYSFENDIENGNGEEDHCNEEDHNDLDDKGYYYEDSSDDDDFLYQYNFKGHNKESEKKNEEDPKYLKRKLAETKKNIGNLLFKQKLYESALLQYTQAIHYLPTEAIFYSNRSACYIMLSNYTEAMADARIAIICDKTFKEAYMRLLHCLIVTGDYNTGFEVIDQFLDVYPKSSALLKEYQECKELKALDILIGVCYANREYNNVLVYLNKALKIATASKVYRTLKAECEILTKTKDYYEILGVPKNFTTADLKAAFRKKAFLHHPDKHSGLSEEHKKIHEEQFKLVKEAFDVLSGTKK
ncbi:DNAJC7 family protein [Megaselia abdita]